MLNRLFFSSRYVLSYVRFVLARHVFGVFIKIIFIGLLAAMLTFAI